MTPDDRLLAAELSIGLIEGPERAAALERVLAEPDFAQEVAWWRRKLASLSLDYGSSEAPALLEQRIDAMLHEHATIGPPAPILPSRSARWPWTLGGGVLGAVAASAAMLLLVPRPAPRTQASAVQAPVQLLLVAPLTAATEIGQTAVAVVIDRRTRALQVVGDIKVPAGRNAELWRIGESKVPVALGIVPAGKGIRLRLSRDALPATTDTIAISIEPEGGAPGPAPTGPVVATGILEEA